MQPQAARGWRPLVEAVQGAASMWIFALKGALAVLVTGWIALRLSLLSPGSAMLTCAIVMYPQSGMVLAKSFYRACGTLVGCLAAMVLVAAFPQQRLLLLLSMALWLGLTAGGASLQRNFKSYGFAVAGYTSAIVWLPAVAAPGGLFDSAVMRASEVLLGILVAGIVSDAIAPQRLSLALRDALRAQFTHFLALLRDHLLRPPAPAEVHDAARHFIRSAVDVENMRSSALFEDAGVRTRSIWTRRTNQRFMAATTTYRTLRHLLYRLQEDDRTQAGRALMRLCAPLHAALAAIDTAPPVPAQMRALLGALVDLDARLQTEAGRLRAGVDAAQRMDFDAGSGLLAALVGELRGYAQIYLEAVAGKRVHGGRRRDPGAGDFAVGNDWLVAASVTVRTTFTMLLLGVFWIATGWPGGAIAMLMATVLSALSASRPNPHQVLSGSWKGALLGGAAAFVCSFGILVHTDGYLLFAAVMAPFLFCGYCLYSLPALGMIPRTAVLVFVFLQYPAFLGQYDVPTFITNGLGFLAGIGAASAGYWIFPNAAENRLLYRRLLRRLRAEVALACHGPLAGAQRRLESVSRDLCVQIIDYGAAGSDRARADELLGWVLSVRQVGRALVNLRQDSLGSSDTVLRRLRHVVAAMNALYQAPTPPRYQRALRATTLALAGTTQLPAAQRHLHLLRLALLDRQSVLARYMPAPEAAA